MIMRITMGLPQAHLVDVQTMAATSFPVSYLTALGKAAHMEYG